MKRWTNGLPGATKRLGANLALRGLSVSQSGCARIPMMARSKIAPLQRPNTLMQLSRSSVLELPLATRGRAIHLAHPGRAVYAREGLLMRLERTNLPLARNDAIDPTRTLPAGAWVPIRGLFDNLVGAVSSDCGTSRPSTASSSRNVPSPIGR